MATTQKRRKDTRWGGWGDPMSYSDVEFARSRLTRPNKFICILCLQQAVTEAAIEHVEGCPNKCKLGEIIGPTADIRPKKRGRPPKYAKTEAAETVISKAAEKVAHGKFTDAELAGIVEDTFTSPESSNVVGGSYDRETKEAVIAFQDKKAVNAPVLYYAYAGVAVGDWEALKSVVSKGLYVRSYFRVRYKGRLFA